MYEGYSLVSQVPPKDEVHVAMEVEQEAPREAPENLTVNELNKSGSEEVSQLEKMVSEDVEEGELESDEEMDSNTRNVDQDAAASQGCSGPHETTKLSLNLVSKLEKSDDHEKKKLLAQVMRSDFKVNYIF